MNEHNADVAGAWDPSQDVPEEVTGEYPGIGQQDFEQGTLISRLKEALATCQSLSDQVHDMSKELDSLNLLNSAAEARERTSSNLLEGVADAIREDGPVSSYHQLPKQVGELVQRNQWQSGVIAFYRQLFGTSDTTAPAEQMVKYKSQEKELDAAKAKIAKLEDEYGHHMADFMEQDEHQTAIIKGLRVRVGNLEQELLLVKAQAFDTLQNVLSKA